MSGEFDPAAELGLFPDKTFVCNCRGFLTKNNNVRDLCDRFISNGAHLYDVLCRYDDLTAYVLGREEATAGDSLKWAVAFMKAFGASDHSMNEYSAQCQKLMPEAEGTMRYISNLMPTFITTSMYEHGMLPLLESLDAPLCEHTCSRVEMDHADFGRAESRKIRDMAVEVAALRVPKVVYELNVPMEVDADDVKIIKTLDRIIGERMPETPAMNLMESMTAINSHKKAYRLLDIRRQTNIDLDSTFYIGGDATDYQAMDLVRDSGGISVSFNGADFAVRGCNIAVLSKDSMVGALLAHEFYNKGYQSVVDLANNWSRKTLKDYGIQDQNLLDCFLKAHPRKLPDVYLVDKHNRDQVAEKSAAYRKKLLGA